ncbi:hypothetical protein CRP345_gp42 [Roseobacter phage CRP-345]|jgi:hypothetical protein|nr:hypothetical protein CRP345_gp42 [Roseobacter phage CRP-345]
MASRRELITGPVPGMGMTAELGGRPWQKPPQYTTVEEALDYYLPRFTDPDVLEQLLDVMELGIPLVTIAEGMQSAAVMEGLHTIDVGMLVIPVLVEMMAYIGDDAGIEYSTGIERRRDEDEFSDTKIALAMKKLRERLPEELEAAQEERDAIEGVDEEPMMEEEQEQAAPEQGGLMARRA